KQALCSSLKASTIAQYNGYLSRFAATCSSYDGLSSWRQATPGHIMEFLCDIASGLNRPSASLDTAMAALRLAFYSVRPSPLDSPLIARVKKGLVSKGTTRPRLPTQPLPVAPLRDWLRTLAPISKLDYEKLRMKCAVLAAMTLIARPSDLCCINT